MKILLLIALIVTLLTDAADARRRRGHHWNSDMMVVPREGPQAFAQDPRVRFRRGGPPTLAALVPQGWQLEPPNPNWTGKRFLSPDGSSWFAVYRTPAQNVSVSDHMRSVMFADGETITYLRGERTWVAVSGFKEGRIFYRRAVLACAGKSWHHVAFEYPTEFTNRMESFVTAAAGFLNEHMLLGIFYFYENAVWAVLQGGYGGVNNG